MGAIWKHQQRAVYRWNLDCKILDIVWSRAADADNPPASPTPRSAGSDTGGTVTRLATESVWIRPSFSRVRPRKVNITGGVMQIQIEFWQRLASRSADPLNDSTRRRAAGPSLIDSGGYEPPLAISGTSAMTCDSMAARHELRHDDMGKRVGLHRRAAERRKVDPGAGAVAMTWFMGRCNSRAPGSSRILPHHEVRPRDFTVPSGALRYKRPHHDRVVDRNCEHCIRSVQQSAGSWTRAATRLMPCWGWMQASPGAAPRRRHQGDTKNGQSRPFYHPHTFLAYFT